MHEGHFNFRVHDLDLLRLDSSRLGANFFNKVPFSRAFFALFVGVRLQTQRRNMKLGVMFDDNSSDPSFSLKLRGLCCVRVVHKCEREVAENDSARPVKKKG